MLRFAKTAVIRQSFMVLTSGPNALFWHVCVLVNVCVSECVLLCVCVCVC